jgi:hypothetical protein
LPFADIQTRIGAANRGIALIVDRGRVHGIELTIRLLSAMRRNRRQTALFLLLTGGLLVRVQPEEPIHNQEHLMLKHSDEHPVLGFLQAIA